MTRRLVYIAFVAALAVLLASCATMSVSKGHIDSLRPRRAQRSYVQIAARTLYPLLEHVFVQEGFTIAGRNYSRGYFRTDWLEYPGRRHGLVRWRERRRYSAFFDIDRLTGRNLLILDLQVEERAPVSSGWREEDVDTSEDAQYQRILRELDDAVQKDGGRLV